MLWLVSRAKAVFEYADFVERAADLVVRLAITNPGGPRTAIARALLLPKCRRPERAGFSRIKLTRDPTTMENPG